MLLVDEKKLDTMLKEKYDKGVADGIKTGIRLMEERILLACENGNPLDIKGKVYFIKSDIQNLRDLMDDIEAEYNAEEIALENKEKQLSTLKQNQECNRSVQMDKTENSEKSHTFSTHTREQVAKMSGVGTGTVARYDAIMKTDEVR